MRKQSKSEEFAKQLAKLLGCKVNTICTIEKRKETFAFESNHKIKRTLRVILASAKKQRIIGISDNLTAVIREYKEWYDNYREALCDRWINSNRLFIKENGDGLYPSTVEGWVHKICQAAGLPHRTVHSLRCPPCQKRFKAALSHFSRADPITITVFRLKDLVMVTIR